MDDKVIIRELGIYQCSDGCMAEITTLTKRHAYGRIKSINLGTAWDEHHQWTCEGIEKGRKASGEGEHDIVRRTRGSEYIRHSVMDETDSSL